MTIDPAAPGANRGGAQTKEMIDMGRVPMLVWVALAAGAGYYVGRHR